jgi:hypothetical protein
VDDRRRDLVRRVACDQVDDAVDEGGVIERERRQIVAPRQPSRRFCGRGQNQSYSLASSAMLYEIANKPVDILDMTGLCRISQVKPE